VTFYRGDEFLRPLTATGETYSIVGDGYGTKIGLRRNGDVWSVDPERQLALRFINTSIAHVVLFLGFENAKGSRTWASCARNLTKATYSRRRTKINGGASSSNK
jgi:hypothetical protein